MRSELLYTTSQAYLADTIVTAPTGDSSLQLYGRGEGTVDWDGTAGTIEWTNLPELRPDGLFTPNVTGVIRIGIAAIMYRMTGLSLEPDDSGFRRFVGSVQWWTDASEFRWLTKRFGLEEGTVDTSNGSLTSTVYDVTPFDVEVLSGLRRLVAIDRLDDERAAGFRRVLAQADIRRHPHTPLIDVIWSMQHSVSAYDAAYVALASALDAPLVTTDRKLANLPGLPCAVEVP